MNQSEAQTRPADLTFFLRNVLSQGGAIYLDYANKTYEEYARRLDIAAIERSKELTSLVSSPDAAVVAAEQIKDFVRPEYFKLSNNPEIVMARHILSRPDAGLTDDEPVTAENVTDFIPTNSEGK